MRVLELGCGLGLPALVAAARGAAVLAIDWAPDAIVLLAENAARNHLDVRTLVHDWREPLGETFDLVLAADVLYEERNVEPVAAAVTGLAPTALVGLAGRPYEAPFLRLVDAVEIAPRVVRIGG